MPDAPRLPQIDIQRLRIVNRTGAPLDAGAIAAAIEGRLGGLAVAADGSAPRLATTVEARSTQGTAVADAAAGAAAAMLAGGAHAR